jgi:hypothetical protein
MNQQLVVWAMTGLLILAIAGLVWYVWQPFTNPPADISAEDPKAIAQYKQWIRDHDLPFVGGKIKTAELPQAFRKVIDYDVKTGDLKSAREFIRLATERKLDDQVLDLCQLPQAKELIQKTQEARRKVQALLKVAERVEKTGAGKGDKEAKLDKQLELLVEVFCAIPIDPVACPELAAEAVAIYRSRLAPLRQQVEILELVGKEIDERCVPISGK